MLEALHAHPQALVLPYKFSSIHVNSKHNSLSFSSHCRHCTTTDEICMEIKFNVAIYLISMILKRNTNFCYSIISSDIFKMLYKLNRFLSSPKVLPYSTLASYFRNKALISSTRLASPQDLALAAANLVLEYWQVKHNQKMLQSEFHSN